MGLTGLEKHHAERFNKFRSDIEKFLDGQTENALDFAADAIEELDAARDANANLAEQVTDLQAELDALKAAANV